MDNRKGIISAGNWIVDYVKIIDRFPSENMLANILDVYKSVGGGPNNVLTDLSKMKVDIPLYGAGLVGDDADGDYIFNQIDENGINKDYMQRTSVLPTSFTDAMSVIDTGNRTFFHYRGANAQLKVEHLIEINANAKIFHLAYLLLLDELDSEDLDYGVKAARLLKHIREKGYKTSIDVVSEEGERFKKVVSPCLQYVDYLIINEIEAAAISGISLLEDGIIQVEKVKEAALQLIRLGVNELVVIHCPEGACLVDTNDKIVWIPSWKVDTSEIAGATGAGDAFCTGCLYAIHEGWPYEKVLQLGHSSARFNLMEATATGGAVTLTELEAFMGTEVQLTVI